MRHEINFRGDQITIFSLNKVEMKLSMQMRWTMRRSRCFRIDVIVPTMEWPSDLHSTQFEHHHIFSPFRRLINRRARGRVSTPLAFYSLFLFLFHACKRSVRVHRCFVILNYLYLRECALAISHSDLKCIHLTRARCVSAKSRESQTQMSPVGLLLDAHSNCELNDNETKGMRWKSASDLHHAVVSAHKMQYNGERESYS